MSLFESLRRQTHLTEAGRLVILEIEDFPILRYWYVVHRKGKNLSACGGGLEGICSDVGAFLDFCLRLRANYT